VKFVIKNRVSLRVTGKLPLLLSRKKVPGGRQTDRTQLGAVSFCFFLQEIFAHRLFRRHAPRALRRGFKDSIPPAGCGEVPVLPAGAGSVLSAYGLPSALVAVGACDAAAVAAVFAELEDGGYVATAVAVIGRGPDGHDGLVEHLFVAFHDKLVGARDEGEVVVVVEVADNVGAEEESCTARREAPAFDLVWVGPEEIAHGAFVGDFLFAVYQTDLVDRFNQWGEPAVDTEHGAGGGGWWGEEAGRRWL